MDTQFTKIDEWCGYATRSMWDKEFEAAVKSKKKDQINTYKAMDQNTLAATTDDIWIINEHPNIRINFKKNLPRSFENLFEDEEQLRTMETFKIGRKAFQNKLPQISQYLSYFAEFYDPEKELLSLYMYMKNIIDNGTQSLTVEEFKKHLMGKLVRDYDIKENIYRMINDNHYIDATTDGKTNRKFVDPDDFTNEDVKRLLSISMMLKIIIPPVEHYISTNSIYTSDDPLIHQLTMSLFSDIFFFVGDQYDEYEADELQRKLYKFSEKKVEKHYKANKVLWDQQSALRGITENSQLDKILVKFILADNFFKFRCNNALTSFLKAVINTQLDYTITRVQYKLDPIEIKMESDGGGDNSNGKDKTAQMTIMIDETQDIRARKALQDVLDRLEAKFGKISTSELDFYIRRLNNMDTFHDNLVNYNYAKYFDGFSELKIASDKQVIKFLIYMKRQCIEKGYQELQWLVSSILVGKVSNRLLQNTKFLNKLTESSTYKHLVEDVYSVMYGGLDYDPILKMISHVLNNTHTFNEYEYPELTGEIIEFNEDIISDEILNFIESI